VHHVHTIADENRMNIGFPNPHCGCLIVRFPDIQSKTFFWCYHPSGVDHLTGQKAVIFRNKTAQLAVELEDFLREQHIQKKARCLYYYNG